MDYRLWVSEDGTVLARLWEDGSMEVCTRPTMTATWGPPITMVEEESDA